MLVQALITSKQPTTGNFGARYMLPSMIVACLINSMLVLAYFNAAKSGAYRYAGKGVLIVITFAILLGGYRTIAWGLNARLVKGELESILVEAEVVKDCLLASYYGSPSPEYALAFGNNFSDRRFGNQLSSLYPDALFYDIAAKNFFSFQAQKLDKPSGCVVLFGKTYDAGQIKQNTGFDVTTIFVNKSASLYRITEN
jgi:hypothetical protein